MISCLPTQALAFLAVFVYATNAMQAIAFEWKPGLTLKRFQIKSCKFLVCLLKVIRDGGSVGAVEVTWMINSTDDSQQAAGRHQFVAATGSVGFNASQRLANLSVAFVNDESSSLDTNYRLMLTNVSQVTAGGPDFFCVLKI